MSNFVDSFQEKIWKDKYQYNDETFEEFCNRISGNLFNDKSDEANRVALKSLLLDFKVLFGGRINSNIGISEEGLTLFNCFIESIVENPDSLEGILEMVTKYAVTLKTEGGVGFCANFLRPSRTLIKKIGVTTPGSIKFLEIFDKVSEVITSGSVDKGSSYQGLPTKKSIRKGATMVTMSINHPDVEDFITAKSIPNRLTKMNMSVLITDAFMYSVENDLDWVLWFPQTSFEKYDSEWDGDFEKWAEKGYPTVTYKKVKAIFLWDLLLKNSYNRNEPGIIFIDNVRRANNLSYLNGNILASNPCVVEGTLVSTGSGLKKVEDFVEDDFVQTTLGVGKVKSVEKNDNIDVYEVCFSDGFSQCVTAGHIFHTMENSQESRKKWNNTVRLKDLKVGQYVRKSWYQNFPNLRPDLNRDKGLLIGLYLGDGSFSNYQCFNISSNSTENNDFIEGLFRRLGGSCRIDKSEGNCVRYYFTDKNNFLKDLFDGLNIDPNGKSFDILSLLNTNRSFICGLLDGLLSSDGNINLTGRYPQVRFDNSNQDLHLLMKHLMLFVKADYKKYSSKKIGEISTIYGRTITRKKDCDTGVIDNDSILNLYREIGYLSHEDKNNLLIKIIKTYSLNGVKWKAQIKSIKHIGKRTTYDLYEPIADDWNHEGYVSRGCGEVFGHTGVEFYEGSWLQLGDVCNLGSINLTRFYNVDENRFDYDSFLSAADLMVKALDRVIEVSKYPLKIYEDAAKLKRKVGVGLMGVGSLLMMMNIRYGSLESVSFLEDLLSKFMNQIYKTSALLAKELGPFPLYEAQLLGGGYVKNSGVLTDETIDLIKKHGLRNSAISAIAPNGSLSIVAGNVSGGLEPVFSTQFNRWNRVEGKKVDFEYPNIHRGEWFETDYLKEQKVADEVILMSVDEKYRVDKNSGLCEKITIKDYGYKVAEQAGGTEVATAMGLSVDEHLNILKVFAKYVDQSCSKTINLPSDISFEDFKSLYGQIHQYGVKGCTTYREGSSTCVLEAISKDRKKTVVEQQKAFLDAFHDQDGSDIIVQDVKLPEEYPAKGYILRSEGKKWYLHVAFKDMALTRPFAIFVNTNHREDNVSTFNALDELEKLSISMGLNNGLLDEVKVKYAYQKNPVKICRMLGFLLRHNVRVYHIVKALDNVTEAGPGTFVFRMKKFLAQFVKYSDEPLVCPECGEKTLIMQEGCYVCSSCGSSKCS